MRGLFVWAIGVWLAFAGLSRLVPGEAHTSAWLIVAAAAISIAVAHSWIGEPASSASDAASPIRNWRVRLAFLAIGVAGAAAPLAISGLAGAMLWLVGLFLVAVSLSSQLLNRETGFSSILPPLPRHTLGLAAILAILILAVWLRLPDLAALPPEVHGDEAAIGNEARRLAGSVVFPLFGVGWYDVPNISFALPLLTMLPFGDDLFGLRLASAIQGVASIGLTYLLARRLFGDRVGIIAAFILAVAAWHIHFSRTGFHYMQAVFATVLVLYFVVRGLDRRSTADLFIAGLAAGLCLNVYYAARLAPVIAAIYALHRLAAERGTRWPGLVAAPVGAALFLLPMLPVFAGDPAAFMSRTNGVSIFSASNQAHILGSLNVASISDAIVVQAVRTAEAFPLRGETSLQYGHPAALIDPATAALAFGGLLALPVWRPRYGLLVVWIALTLVVGGILTIDALFSPRVVGILPAIAIVAALTLDTGWRAADRFRWGAWIAVAPVALIAVFMLNRNVDDYFAVHVTREQPAGYRAALGRYLADLPTSSFVVVTGGTDPVLSYETVRFLAPSVQGIDIRNAVVGLPYAGVPAGSTLVGIVDLSAPNAASRVQRFRDAYPAATVETHTNGRGDSLFVSIRVSGG